MVMVKWWVKCSYCGHLAEGRAGSGVPRSPKAKRMSRLLTARHWGYLQGGRERKAARDGVVEIACQ